MSGECSGFVWKAWRAFGSLCGLSSEHPEPHPEYPVNLLGISAKPASETELAEPAVFLLQCEAAGSGQPAYLYNDEKENGENEKTISDLNGNDFSLCTCFMRRRK